MFRLVRKTTKNFIIPFLFNHRSFSKVYIQRCNILITFFIKFLFESFCDAKIEAIVGYIFTIDKNWNLSITMRRIFFINSKK